MAGEVLGAGLAALVTAHPIFFPFPFFSQS
jgi:hypothetical protein